MAVLCHVLSIFHRRRPGKASTIMRRLTTACLLIFTALSVVNAQALVEFDFEQKFLVETEPLIKDHCLIRENGVFHLFYLRGDPAIDIGHASSTDLIHWTVEDAVLSVEPGTWDDLAMWAPQVFKIGNGWMMYYTGVNLASSQQTGIAFSTDLYDWFKLPWPVYHPDPLTWAEWSPNAFSHGRDPFVFKHEGLFYMLNTAKTWFNKGAVACAVSTDGFAWQDAGPLFVNNTWHVMESLQCLERNGRFHMFFTEEGVAGTSHMSSDSLASGWNIASRRIIDFGHAAEVTPFDGHYIFSRHAVYNADDGIQRFIIRLDTLKWPVRRCGMPATTRPSSSSTALTTRSKTPSHGRRSSGTTSVSMGRRLPTAGRHAVDRPGPVCSGTSPTRRPSNGRSTTSRSSCWISSTRRRRTGSRRTSRRGSTSSPTAWAAGC